MMSEEELLKNIVDRVPFIVSFLDIQIELADNEISATLPFKPMLIGNDFIKALHGGAIGVLF